MSAPRLIALATAVPPHIVQQSDVRELVSRLFPETLGKDRALSEVFDNARIKTRNLCAPPEWHDGTQTFRQKNDLYVEWAERLGAGAARAALGQAGLEPRDVDHIVFVSSTGIATPSLDALLANSLGLRSDVRRTPIWGLGCAGGAAGIARAREFALADPKSRVLMIALELCSLTFQRADMSVRNVVATALFADGAAAGIVAGSEAPAPRAASGALRPIELLASGSTLWKDSLDVMGWKVDDGGLHVVFARDIPTIVRERMRERLEAFLAANDLDLGRLRHLVLHPGGAKVLVAYEESFELPPGALHHSWDVLRDHGNMSAPTCLFVLERFMQSGDIGPGESALLSALGPGFSAEFVLMRGAPD